MPDIDATVGGSDSNSYIDLDEALDRADERIGSSGWLGLSSDDQIRSLITASRAIDSLDLIGDPTDDDQALHFPIDGADTLPLNIPRATLELAISYAPYLATVAAGGTASDPASPTPNNIKEDTVGPLTTIYFSPTEMGATDNVSLASFPASVQRLLAGFVRVASTATWGVGTAVRAS